MFCPALHVICQSHPWILCDAALASPKRVIGSPRHGHLGALLNEDYPGRLPIAPLRVLAQQIEVGGISGNRPPAAVLGLCLNGVEGLFSRRGGSIAEGLNYVVVIGEQAFRLTRFVEKHGVSALDFLR